MTSYQLSLVTRKLFPDVRIKNRRSKDNWAVREAVYHGVHFITPTDGREVQYCDISANAPPNVFLMNQSSTSAHFGVPTIHIVNGLHLMKEVIFHSVGQWELRVGTVTVNLAQLGFSDKYEMTTNGIQTVFNSVALAVVCTGRPVTKQTTMNTICVDENWSKQGDENSGESRLRTDRCSRIVNINAKGTLCLSCQSLMKRKTYEVAHPVNRNKPCDDTDGNTQQPTDNTQQPITTDNTQQPTDRQTTHAHTTTIQTDQDDIHNSVTLCENDNND
jgi:hypothetical protein